MLGDDKLGSHAGKGRPGRAIWRSLPSAPIQACAAEMGLIGPLSVLASIRPAQFRSQLPSRLQHHEAEAALASKSSLKPCVYTSQQSKSIATFSLCSITLSCLQLLYLQELKEEAHHGSTKVLQLQQQIRI